MDLIDRQKAVDALMERFKRVPTNAIIAKDVIENLPSAQPTATWLIHKWGDDAKCSNCGRSFKDVYDMDNYDQYCRHCGTQMKGVEQHERCDLSPAGN